MSISIRERETMITLLATAWKKGGATIPLPDHGSCVWLRFRFYTIMKWVREHAVDNPAAVAAAERFTISILKDPFRVILEEKPIGDILLQAMAALDLTEETASPEDAALAKLEADLAEAKEIAEREGPQPGETQKSKSNKYY